MDHSLRTGDAGDNEVDEIYEAALVNRAVGVKLAAGVQIQHQTLRVLAGEGAAGYCSSNLNYGKAAEIRRYVKRGIGNAGAGPTGCTESA